VFWLGCEPAPPLELLQDAIERAFAAIGFPVEGRPFRPHVTIGRARKDARGGVRGAEAHLDRLTFADGFTVESIDLMESTLTPSGARYAVRAAVRLA
jgi:2'-5' RNA ligase